MAKACLERNDLVSKAYFSAAAAVTRTPDGDRDVIPPVFWGQLRRHMPHKLYDGLAMSLHLQDLVADFAATLRAAYAKRPAWKAFLPGIGPHAEDAAVAFTLSEMRTANSPTLARQRVVLGERIRADFRDLVHPVHGRGSVSTWEVLEPADR